jgi:hypothetical protein
MNLRVKILAKLTDGSFTATDLARSLRSVSVPTYLWCLRRDGLVSVIKPHLPAGGSRKVLERNGISQRYVITAKGSKWLLGSLIKHVGS